MPTARIATKSAEILMALKLRYDVFFLEGGDERYADHEQKVWADCDDGPQSHLLVAVDDGDIVIGTVRLTVLRDWEFIAINAFRLPVLAKYLGVRELELRDRVARVDRGVVAQPYRRRGVQSALQSLAEQVALQNKCDILVGATALDNVPARRANQKLGWNDYNVSSTHGGFTCQAIFKKLLPQTLTGPSSEAVIRSDV